MISSEDRQGEEMEESPQMSPISSTRKSLAMSPILRRGSIQATQNLASQVEQKQPKIINRSQNFPQKKLVCYFQQSRNGTHQFKFYASLTRPLRQDMQLLLVFRIFGYIKDFTFFKKFFGQTNINLQDEETIYYLCSKMQLEVFTQGQVIFRQGEESNDKMYVVIQGKIGICINKGMIQIDFVKKEKTSWDKLFQVDQTDNLDQIIKQFGKKVNEVQQGEGFGEKALLEENKKLAIRSATCICMTDSILISLNRDSFLEVIQQFRQGSKDKLEFLMNTVPQFDKISSQQTIESLMYSFKDDLRYQASIITEEGQVGEWVYLLLNGEVAIIKEGKYQIAILTEHSKELIGEEILINFDKPLYKFTVQVRSQEAKFLKISLSSLRFRAPQECIQSIIQLYEMKQSKRYLVQKELQKQEKLTNKILFDGVYYESNNLEGVSKHPFKKKFNAPYYSKLGESEQASSIYLRFTQKKQNLLLLRKLALINLMKQLGHQQMGQIQGMESKCVEYVKRSQIYKNDQNVRNLIDMDDQWVKDCDVELVKQALAIQSNFRPGSISLKNGERGMKDLQLKIEEPIDLELIKKNYLKKQNLEDKKETIVVNISDEDLQRKSYFKLINEGHITIKPPKFNPVQNEEHYTFRSNICKKKMKFQSTSRTFNQRSIQIQSFGRNSSQQLTPSQDGFFQTSITDRQQQSVQGSIITPIHLKNQSCQQQSSLKASISQNLLNFNTLNQVHETAATSIPRSYRHNSIPMWQRPKLTIDNIKPFAEKKPSFIVANIKF